MIIFDDKYQVVKKGTYKVPKQLYKKKTKVSNLTKRYTTKSKITKKAIKKLARTQIKRVKKLKDPLQRKRDIKFYKSKDYETLVRSQARQNIKGKLALKEAKVVGKGAVFAPEQEGFGAFLKTLKQSKQDKILSRMSRARSPERARAILEKELRQNRWFKKLIRDEYGVPLSKIKDDAVSLLGRVIITSPRYRELFDKHQAQVLEMSGRI